MVVQGCLQCKSSCKRTRWLTNISLKAKITSKKQVLKWVAFLTEGEDRLNVNRTAKNTLGLINLLRIQHYSLTNYRIQFNLQRKKIILKTLVLSREANALPQCKLSCEEQAGFDRNWRVKAYSLIAAALNAIYKANQCTNSPFKLEIVLKLAYLLGPLEP